MALHNLKTRCVWFQLVNDVYKINPSEYEINHLGGGDEELARQKILLKELEKDNNIKDPN